MLRLPFGVKNGTSMFMRAMKIVFKGLEWCVIIYVDDILVFTKTPNFCDHLAALRLVFDRLIEFNLKLSPKKCFFAMCSVEYLGHTIDKNGHTPNTSLVKAILDYPTPTNAKEVRSFYGAAGFFRKFIENFASIGSPLSDLTKKDSKTGKDVKFV